MWRPLCRDWINCLTGLITRTNRQTRNKELLADKEQTVMSGAYYPMDASVQTQITAAQFQQRQQAARDLWRRTYLDAGKPVILVGWGSCSVIHGAVETFRAIRAWLDQNRVDAVLRRTGCFGSDYVEPQVDIMLAGGPRISYGQITADKVPELLRAVLIGKDLKKEWAFCVVDREDFDNSTQGYQGIPAAKDL